MENATAISVARRGGSQPRPLHARVATLATGQGGVVTRGQLIELGHSSSAVDRAIGSGRLTALHPGVFAVGHRAIGPVGWRHAAILACGAGAVLSHGSAAEVWDLRATSQQRHDVTVPRTLRPRDRIRPHRARLAPDEHTTLEGLPITTVARTLLDLAATLDRHGLERAVERAEITRRLDRRALATLLDRYPRRAGSPALRALLAAGPLDARLTRSQREEAFLAFLDEHQLPRPQTNLWMALDDGEGPGVEIDAAWPAARLAAELDPRATHDTAAAFERDRRKDQRLLLAGWRVVRITPRRLREEPDRVADLLRRLLVA